jgi:23S rRNA G2445 N2-methylase RlmL
VRLQEEIAVGEVRSEEALYAFVRGLEWERWLDVEQTLAVDASVRDACLTHSHYAALRVKDAIVDRFRDHRGRRPSVDTGDPDLPLKLHLRGATATLYRDLSGESLHKRGYRPVQVKSPLNEATAAGLVLLSEWDRASPLLDPMCGSATLPIEAALIAGDRAPGLRRRYAFERWSDFDRRVWKALREEARDRARAGAARIPEIAGADRHPGAIAIARRAVEAAELRDRVRLTVAEVRDLVPVPVPAVVLTNPPYGERLGAEAPDDVAASWRDLGAFLHERCGGATAWILCGSPELSRHLGLRASRRVPVHNGPIDCRLLCYEIDAHCGETT